MVTVQSQPASQTHPTWSLALAQPAAEFAPTKLQVIAGSIPAGLRGSLYRNGPARLQRGRRHVQHWFDGDGAVLGVHFTDAGATGVYRYVQTAGYQAEETAGTLLYGGYGTLPAGPIWQRWRRGVKNAANTSVLALPDQLLTLWEGGHPHRLDLDTLETEGLVDLGALRENQPYSAHPKCDPSTGDIYNFGVTFGKQGQLNLYRSNATGKIQQQNAIPLEALALIHDFVLAGPYLVFCIPPVHLNAFSLLTQWRSYSDSLTWRPDRSTQILVIDRQTLELVSRSEVDPWYQWHFGNGYVDDHGAISIDLVRYPDFQTNQYLKEVATGQIHTPAPSQLWRLQLNPQTAQIEASHPLLDRICEFPVVHPRHVGHPTRFTYLSISPTDAEPTDLFRAIARFDHHTGEVIETDLGHHRYPMEPIVAPDQNNSDQDWIVTVVFDGEQNCSEVWIFDSDRLDTDPVCRLALPSVVPMGFHGTWRQA